MARVVAQATTSAGGREMKEDDKEALLTQLLARRVGLQRTKEPFDTFVAHHPKGKPVWDLEDEYSESGASTSKTEQ